MHSRRQTGPGAAAGAAAAETIPGAERDAGAVYAGSRNRRVYSV